MVEGEDDAPGAQGDALGLAGQRGREDRRVGRQPTELVEVPLGEPEPGQARAVGEARAVEDQVVLAGLELGRVVAEEVEAEEDPTVGIGDRRRGRGRLACNDRGNARLDAPAPPRARLRLAVASWRGVE